MDERTLSNDHDYNERVRRYQAAHQRGYHDYDYAKDNRNLYDEHYEFIAYCAGWEKKRKMRCWLRFENKYLKS